MPGMIRPHDKSAKILYKIKGIPKDLQQSHSDFDGLHLDPTRPSLPRRAVAKPDRVNYNGGSSNASYFRINKSQKESAQQKRRFYAWSRDMQQAQ